MSIWFCDGCHHLVGRLNSRLGRYAVPIGAHSLHGGFGLTADANEIGIEIDADRWQHVSNAIGRVFDWSTIITRQILKERFGDVRDPVPIDDYLDRCTNQESEKSRCFRAMVAYFQGVPSSEQ